MNQQIKKNKIDLFLKQMQLLSHDYEITPKQIYLQLANYNIPEEDRMQDVSDVFENLEKNNINRNVNIFVDPRWSYFCQFKSYNSSKIAEMNPIKIYIPLKKENIENNVKKTIDFIANNNIIHASKLARNIRVDNLVVRVTNQIDADKIIEFVNSSKEITDTMYESNPFCIQEGKVAMAMDRSLSYNDIVSKYIHRYITIANQNSKEANIDDFITFIKENYNNLINKADITEIIEIKGLDRRPSMSVFLHSVEEITYILINALEGQNKKVLYQYFEYVNNKDVNARKKLDYYEFDDPNINKKNYDLLQELIMVMSNKYGIEKTIAYIEKYKQTGGLNLITRSNNLRERIRYSSSFRTYIANFNISSFYNLENSNKELEEKSKILKEICKTTYYAFNTKERKFRGRYQVASLLRHIEENDYTYITRTNNARGIAENNISPTEVEQLVKYSIEQQGIAVENNEEMYRIYSEYIEQLCYGLNTGKGRK